MPSADALVQALSNGLSLGCLIGLLAVGYSQVYGVAKIINFAHGEVFALSAFYTLSFTTMPARVQWHALGIWLTIVSGLAALSAFRAARPGWRLFALAAGSVIGGFTAYLSLERGLSPLLALMLSLLFTIATGMACEYVVYTPILRASRLVQIVAAIGLSFFLQGVMQFLFGAERRQFPASITDSLRSGMVNFSGLDIAIIVTTVILTLTARWVASSTIIGIQIRAIADDPVIAARLGVSGYKARICTFASGAGLAAVCSFFFVARQHVLEPTVGYSQGILAFCAAVLGGIGSLSGSLLGGLFIGVLLSVLPLIGRLPLCVALPASVCQWVPSLEPSDWGLGIVYAAIAVALLIRPRGLIAERSRREV